MKKIFVALFSLISLSLMGQMSEPVKWKITTQHISGDEYNVVFDASIDAGWTVYSQHTNDEGPVPTEITYEDQGGVSMLGTNVESGKKKEGFDKIFEVDVIKFLADKNFTITQKVKVTDYTKPLVGYLTYMTCNDKQCLPPTDVDFSLTFDGPRTGGVTPEGNVDVKKEVPQIKEIKGATETPVKKEPAASAPIKMNAAPGAGAITMNGGSIDMAGAPGQGGGMHEPVTWTFESKKVSDNEYDLIYRADIEDEWIVYSQNNSGDGPVPTSITYDNMNGATLVGGNVESGKKKEGFDDVFEMQVIKFLSDEDYVIKQRVKSEDGKLPTGYVTFMTCKEFCLPPTDVEFDFNSADGKPSTASEEITQNISSDGKVDQRRAALVSSYKEPASDCGKGSGNTDDQKSLWWLFMAGILGGFAALLTPCVFPMIPITVSFFTKDTKRKGWMNGLIYGASIVAIYVTLGLLITKLFGAEALNALSTNWIANTLFFLIFIVFAFSFFGFYEITLPSSWTTKTDSMADKGGLLGIFFMAATLSLVSFSCTGPIVGSALVAAASGGVQGPLTVMLGFSLALALPFGLFAAFPAWLNTLPRSGGWMNSVKVVLGFLELGFAFKFLSTADLTQHWGILPYEVFMVILILVAFAIAAYLFGFIKFPHDSPIKKLSLTRKGIATAFLALGLYLCAGFTVNKDTGIYNSLWLTSGFSPPVNYNLLLEKDKGNEDLKAQYISYTKCANNIDCFKDYFEGINYAKKVGKPVFLDFTGHGCQNCRRTEDNIWVDPEIRRILNDEVVLVSLYVDDRGKLKEPFVSLADGKKKRTIGSQWADFQVANFSQNSQPLYIMTTPGEKVITHPRGYVEGIQGYKEYLECGLEAFSKMK